MESSVSVRRGSRFDVSRSRLADGRAVVVKSTLPGPLAQRSDELLHHE
jgi:hypothetical protein